MNATYRPDDKFDRAIRLAHDWAEDCIKTGYVTTGADSHVKMVNAIVAIEADSDRARQAPAPARLALEQAQSALKSISQNYEGWTDSDDEALVAVSNALVDPALVEVSRLAEPAWMTAFDEARDAILNDRGPLEGEGLTNDQTNAVLTILDAAFMPHLRRGPVACDGIAAQIGAVAMRLAKDSGYRHRAAEELLSIQNYLATTASTPASEVPAGWREVLVRAKSGLGAGGRSHSDQAFIDYGATLIDHIECELDSLAATPASPATEGARDFALLRFPEVYGSQAPATEGEATKAYALQLATALWERHYKTQAPDWEPLDDTLGLLTQIDNMVAGLATPIEAEAQKAVAIEHDEQLWSTLVRIADENMYRMPAESDFDLIQRAIRQGPERDQMFMGEPIGPTRQTLAGYWRPPETSFPMGDQWSVEVCRLGDSLLSIGHNWLSGKRELSQADERVILGCAEHLAAFVGSPTSSASTDAVAQWTLIAPDGRRFAGDSPMRCAREEINSRVPASVQVARIFAAVDEPEEAVALTEDEVRSIYGTEVGLRAHSDDIDFATEVQRALAEKNGWRLEGAGHG